MRRGALLLLFARTLFAGQECRACHPAIVESFAKTGMGRSITGRPVSLSADFYHRLSNRHYSVKDGVMRRYQLDAQKREVNVIEKRISFGIGSGNHAVTYVNRTEQGRLIELPLSWYRDLNGWGMSPGYDKPDHFGMRREISDACLFCHAAYPASASERSSPRSIDCERCHGPAAAHLAQPGRGTILNPAKLPAARRLEVCLQCHLETVSQGIPDSFRQPGRNVFSYRPGEPLGAYKLYFDRADSPEPRFEVNHAGYRMLQSPCYKKSAGKLTCTTCHDPHTAKTRNACLDCHSSEHTRQAGAGCAGCHMVKQKTNDAIHVTMTDHWIRAKPVARNPDRESHLPYDGPVVSFYTKADADTLAMANIKAPNARAAEIYRKRAKRDGGDVATLAALGNTLLRLGKRDEAITALDRALKADGGHAGALNTLGVAYAMNGEHERALEIFERSKRANPDHSLTWLNLGVTYQAMGRTEEARAAYVEAIRLQPDFAEARQKLAALSR